MPRHNIHSERLKAIRKFVSFDYDLRRELTSASKRKIKRYYDEIQALTNRPYQVYRPILGDRLREAQEFAQHDVAKYPDFSVAFLPTDGKNRIKLKFGKKGLKAKTKYVKITYVKLSMRGLLSDPVGYVNKRIKKLKHLKSYTIQAGRYEIPRPFLPESVARGVAELTAKYHDKESDSYFGKWLHGLKGLEFSQQASLNSYMNTKKASIEHGKAERKRAKDSRDKQGNNSG